MPDTILELDALTRRFGAFTAVDALSFTVKAGEVFGLLGSNGAGKTTTIKMLTTLLPPSSGEAKVAGFSIVSRPVEVRRAIGYVPQAVSVDGSHFNPLTYVVDALRTSMLAEGASAFGLGLDYAVILLTTTVLVLVGARLYPHLAT